MSQAKAIVSNAALLWSSRNNATRPHEIIAEGRCVTTQISQIMAVKNTKGIPVRSVRPEKKRGGGVSAFRTNHCH